MGNIEIIDLCQILIWSNYSKDEAMVPMLKKDYS